MHRPALERSTLYSYALNGALLWDADLQKNISSLSISRGPDALRAAIDKIRRDLKKDGPKAMGKIFQRARFHFFPQLDEDNDVWSMIAISNINATVEQRTDATKQQ